MAKKSVEQRNLKRQRMVGYALSSYKKIKSAIKKGSFEEQEQALILLQKRKRDKSPVRIRQRCCQCSRPRGVIRHFGLCRICLREAAMRGDVPGLKKAGW